MDNKLNTGFLWEIQILDKFGNVLDKSSYKNLIVNEGLEHLIRTPWGDTPAISNWYCGIFRSSFLPDRNTKAVDIPTKVGEYVSYEATERPEWEKVYNGVDTYENGTTENNYCDYKLTQDTILNGGFLVSDSTKGGGNGKLLSIIRFEQPKNVSAGQTLRTKTVLTYLSATTI